MSIGQFLERYRLDQLIGRVFTALYIPETVDRVRFRRGAFSHFMTVVVCTHRYFSPRLKSNASSADFIKRLITTDAMSSSLGIKRFFSGATNALAGTKVRSRSPFVNVHLRKQHELYAFSPPSANL